MTSKRFSLFRIKMNFTSTVWCLGALLVAFRIGSVKAGYGHFQDPAKDRSCSRFDLKADGDDLELDIIDRHYPQTRRGKCIYECYLRSSY
ncbi:hypothetical protein Bhyg_12346, partial [Pseudolycoriella hygida]